MYDRAPADARDLLACVEESWRRPYIHAHRFCWMAMLRGNRHRHLHEQHAGRHVVDSKHVSAVTAQQAVVRPSLASADSRFGRKAAVRHSCASRLLRRAVSCGRRIGPDGSDRHEPAAQNRSRVLPPGEVKFRIPVAVPHQSLAFAGLFHFRHRGRLVLAQSSTPDAWRCALTKSVSKSRLRSRWRAKGNRSLIRVLGSG
jgi:hypothetical protein